MKKLLITLTTFTALFLLLGCGPLDDLTQALDLASLRIDSIGHGHDTLTSTTTLTLRAYLSHPNPDSKVSDFDGKYRFLWKIAAIDDTLGSNDSIAEITDSPLLVHTFKKAAKGDNNYSGYVSLISPSNDTTIVSIYLGHVNILVK